MLIKLRPQRREQRRRGHSLNFGLLEAYHLWISSSDQGSRRVAVCLFVQATYIPHEYIGEIHCIIQRQPTDHHVHGACRQLGLNEYAAIRHSPAKERG